MVLPILGTRQSESRARTLGLEVFSAVQGNGSTGANKNAIRRGIQYLESLLLAKNKITEYSRDPLGDAAVIDEVAGIMADFYRIPKEKLKKRLGFFVGAQQGEVALALAIGQKLQDQNKLDVLVQVPGYPNYHRTIPEGFQNHKYYGSKVESLKINDERGYATCEEIENSLKASFLAGRKPILLLTIPSNPQGKSPPREEMVKIAHMLNHYPSVYTIVDQAFMEMDFSRRFETFAEVIADEGLFDLQKRFAYSRTNTKAGGLPTERGNIVVLPDDATIIQAVSDYINMTIFNSSVVSQYLAMGWVEDFHNNQQECVNSYLPEYMRNLTTIDASLKRAGIEHSIPDAGFFTVMDFSSLRGMKVPPEMLKILRERPRESKQILLADVNISGGVIKSDRDIFNLLLFVGNIATKEVVSALPGQFCFYAPEACKLRFCFGMANERLIKAGAVIENVVSQVKEYNRDHIQSMMGQGTALDWLHPNRGLLPGPKAGVLIGR